jgi:hypothetical protein
MTRGFWIAGAILVASNAFALAGASYNRSAVVSRVELTDSDFVRWTTEDSGLTLRFNYLEFYFASDRRIGEARLREIGFDLPDAASASDEGPERFPLPRRALIVIAVGDPERQQWLDDFYVHQLPSTNSEPPASHLIVIDAGGDEAALRSKYADPSHFLILHGVVTASRIARQGVTRWEGQVVSVLPPSLRVPTEMRTAASQTHAKEFEPRFSLTLCIGRRGEPWIENVRPR